MDNFTETEPHKTRQRQKRDYDIKKQTGLDIHGAPCTKKMKISKFESLSLHLDGSEKAH